MKVRSQSKKYDNLFEVAQQETAIAKFIAIYFDFICSH